MSSLCKNFLTPPSATLIGPHKERGSRGYLDLNIKTRLMCICALYMVVICIVMLYAMSITTSLSLSQVDSLSLLLTLISLLYIHTNVTMSPKPGLSVYLDALCHQHMNHAMYYTNAVSLPNINI